MSDADDALREAPEDDDHPTAPDDPEADGALSPDETHGDDVPKMG